MELATFQARMLELMERKVHWAWPAFAGLVPKARLVIHLQQEYATYVRDFPVLVGRAYVGCPVPAVRRELAENLYEEETGGIAAGRPHPELFLEYPRGLGFDVGEFERVTLLPGARVYRDVLDEVTQRGSWEEATAVTTIFVEGTSHERGEVEPSAKKRPVLPLEAHPLVVHYGLPLEHLALTKAHRQVEGNHRAAAWRILLDHVGADARPGVLVAMERALAAWLGYRDDVARACGVVRGPDDAPRLAA